MIKKVLTAFPLLFIIYSIRGQQKSDTLTFSLPEAEKIFLRKNFSILAQQYNIDISKALVKQARYIDNPVLLTDQNIYDGKFFRHKTENNQSYGEIYLQLQQVIKTAGKRNKLIQLAQDNVVSSNQQMNELLRQLRFILAGDFNSSIQFLQTNILYNRQIDALQNLVKGMDEQLKAGNISLKDNVRIKALLFSLQSDQADLQKQIADTQKELRILLQTSDSVFIAPVIDSFSLSNVKLPSLEQLQDSAIQNRPDLKLAQINALTQEHNLDYQKALVVPDITAGIEYDHSNSYVPHYWGLAISLPLPVINRNKGNIDAARLSIRQAVINMQEVQLTANNEVTAAYNKILAALQVLQYAQKEIGDQYEILMEHMIQSYRQRQVSLIEFIDFTDAYKETRLKQLQQQANVRNAAAELNYVTGTNIISLNNP